MAKKILIPAAVVIVVLLVGVVLLVSRQAKAPVIVLRTDPPKISFEEKSHDLGTVAEGIEIPYIFKIHNVGGEPLIIKNVSTSCGCTLLNLKDKFIEPGKVGELEVIMDTTMKQGFVNKEIVVLSNDPKRPRSLVFLAATIAPDTLKAGGLLDRKEERKKSESISKASTALSMANPHSGLTMEGRAEIFTGRCAACHVQQGKGKVGGDLFLADCAMCHGQNAEGAVGPALLPGNYHDQEFVNRIQKTIRYGSEEHLSMPGFLKDAGGPLTDGEINSIVMYLQNKSEQVKEVPGG